MSTADINKCERWILVGHADPQYSHCQMKMMCVHTGALETNWGCCGDRFPLCAGTELIACLQMSSVAAQYSGCFVVTIWGSSHHTLGCFARRLPRAPLWLTRDETYSSRRICVCVNMPEKNKSCTESVCHFGREEQASQKVCVCVLVCVRLGVTFIKGFDVSITGCSNHSQHCRQMIDLLWACFAACIFDCAENEGHSDRRVALMDLTGMCVAFLLSESFSSAMMLQELLYEELTAMNQLQCTFFLIITYVRYIGFYVVLRGLKHYWSFKFL